MTERTEHVSARVPVTLIESARREAGQPNATLAGLVRMALALLAGHSREAAERYAATLPKIPYRYREDADQDHVLTP